MGTYLALFLCFLIAGLALLLARENKLRRALQALCTRLLNRVAQLSEATAEKLPGAFTNQLGLKNQRRSNKSHNPRRHTRP